MLHAHLDLVTRAARLTWPIVGWRGTSWYRWGARSGEVEGYPGSGDAFLLAGQQGQGAAICHGRVVQIHGAWP